VSRPISDADYRSLARFRHALRTFQRFSETAAREAGMTPAHHQLLLAIQGHDGAGSPSLTDIAEQLQLKLHSAGELVGRAAARHLVERRADPDDARRTLLDLTPTGRSKLAELSVLHRDELRRFRREMNDVLRELD
jgi:DNA-binding MarR family transcriptional regulator